jgi:hypothetical protein
MTMAASLTSDGVTRKHGQADNDDLPWRKARLSRRKNDASRNIF